MRTHVRSVRGTHAHCEYTQCVRTLCKALPSVLYDKGDSTLKKLSMMGGRGTIPLFIERVLTTLYLL